MNIISSHTQIDSDIHSNHHCFKGPKAWQENISPSPTITGSAGFMLLVPHSDPTICSLSRDPVFHCPVLVTLWPLQPPISQKPSNQKASTICHSHRSPLVSIIDDDEDISVWQLPFETYIAAAQHSQSLASCLRLPQLRLHYYNVEWWANITGGCWGGGGGGSTGSNTDAGQQRHWQAKWEIGNLCSLNRSTNWDSECYRGLWRVSLSELAPKSRSINWTPVWFFALLVICMNSCIFTGVLNKVLDEQWR